MTPLDEALLLNHAGWATNLWRSVLLGDVTPADAERRCEEAAAGLPPYLAEPARAIAAAVRSGLEAVAECSLTPRDFEARVQAKLQEVLP